MIAWQQDTEYPVVLQEFRGASGSAALLTLFRLVIPPHENSYRHLLCCQFYLSN
jgi:hypothetical protein